MANKNYQQGVRFEREIMADLKASGAIYVARCAGSHSAFDVVSVSAVGVVTLIQAKTTRSVATAERLLRQFKASPPLGYTALGQFHQQLRVKILNNSVKQVTVA